ncbi:unnamed protein product, partial [Meganyctiphanes norvegica]
FVPCLVIILFGTQKIDGREIPVAEFQVSGVASTDSWLLFKGVVPNMTTFSFCMRTRLIQARDTIPIISYAVGNSDNELLIELDIKSQTLRFQCCDFSINKKIPVKS